MNQRNWVDSLLYYSVFLVGVIGAGYHTYTVNLVSNPPFIALLGALAVDLLLAYTMHSLRKWNGDKRIAAIAGTIMFGIVSGTAQVISYKISTGQVMEEWLRFVSSYVIPIASGTGSVIMISLIQLFDQDKNGVPDFLQKQRQSQNSQQMAPRNTQYTPPQAIQGQNSGNSNGNGQTHSNGAAQPAQGQRAPITSVNPNFPSTQGNKSGFPTNPRP